MTDYPFMQKFQLGEINPAEFHHREHVQVAWEMLMTYPFMEAASRYSGSIESLSRAAGAPEKYNLTITLSFISLIAEKMADRPQTNFEGFYSGYPELTDNPLKQWYSDQRLNNDLARRIFLMPEKPTPA